MKNNIINHLYERELINQITDKNKLINLLNKKYINLYCGFDPTSYSLHIGHLIPIICIKKFLEFNNKVIIIIGGSTALIGDPSFKKNKINNNSIINKINEWSENIYNQIFNILNLNKNNNIIFLNNSNWLNSINLIYFLKTIGDKININYILNKKSIKNRINSKNILSFKEFSYNILQGYDFLHLYENYNTILQIGGSDQWGNILSGIELIRKIHKKETFGLTLPIFTNNNGEKIGKSENNSIFLDKTKTSSYKFYQFLINIPDNYVCKFLKFFTNIKIDEINNLLKENNYKNYILGKKIIAKKLTKMIYGNNGFNQALRITDNLFNKNLSELKEEDLNQLYIDKFNSIELKNLVKLKELLIISNIVKTKNQAINLIKYGSIKINGILINDINYKLCYKDLLFKKYTILLNGKKNYYLIVLDNK